MLSLAKNLGALKTGLGKGDRCRSPTSATVLGEPCLKKRLSMDAACGCCYDCSDGAANQLPQKEKADAFLWDQSMEQEGGWKREQVRGGREDQRKMRPGQALHLSGFIKPHPSYSGQRARATLGPTLTHTHPKSQALELPSFPASSPLKGDPESCGSRCQFWSHYLLKPQLVQCKEHKSYYKS